MVLAIILMMAGAWRSYNCPSLSIHHCTACGFCLANYPGADAQTVQDTVDAGYRTEYEWYR
ncbi:hypothetical protein Q7O44_01530 [Shigella flexneri]|nr:hypothetical protein [Shigella flexneri]